MNNRESFTKEELVQLDEEFKVQQNNNDKILELLEEHQKHTNAPK